MRNIRAVVYGVGAMGTLTTRMLMDKEVEIVGAIARSDEKVGKDLGEIAGLGRPLGVVVRRDAAALLAEAKPDIALLAVTSYLGEHAEHLELCAHAGVNALTLSEEALYPWLTAPEITARLDAAAKDHGVTITGGGFQDVFKLNLVTTLTGAVHRVDAVHGLMVYDPDGSGPELARYLRIGEVMEDPANDKDKERPPSFGLIGLHALATALGLTVEGSNSTTRSEVAAEPMVSNSLGITVEPGQIIGQTDIDEVRTKEGVLLDMQLTGRLYRPDEDRGTVRIEWTVAGEPNLTLRVPNVPAAEVICAQLVNRIPDVINAQPGFVTLDALPPPRYHPLPLSAYLHRTGS